MKHHVSVQIKEKIVVPDVKYILITEERMIVHTTTTCVTNIIEEELKQFIIFQYVFELSNELYDLLNE